MTGLSGAGKSTIANETKKLLLANGIKTEIIDGDEYREIICSDLGFTKKDRIENIKRLSFVGGLLLRNNIVVIMSAINPYELSRREVERKYLLVKTVWVNCSLEVLIQRDTKGLYKKALLPDTDIRKITNLTGINDPYEMPVAPALIINTEKESIKESAEKLYQFILNSINRQE